MKVLIVGAGIGGLTTAWRLSRAGAEVTIVEREASLTAKGYSMVIAGQSLQVLAEMGLYDRLAAQRVPVQFSNLMDYQGNLWKRLEITRMNSPGGLGLFLRRSDLHGALLDAATAQPGVALRLGCRPTLLENGQDQARVAFNDENEPESFDLVVGADGLRSWVREQLFGEQGPNPLETGFVAFSLAKAPDGFAPEAYSCQGPGRSVGVTVHPQGGGSGLFWFREAGETVTAAKSDPLPFLRDHYADFRGGIPDLLQALENAEELFMDAHIQVRLDRWSHNRTVLVGDAAHCLSPISAHGASAAMVGGWLLAKQLEVKESIPAALESYQKTFQPVMRKRGEMAQKNQDYLIPKDEQTLRGAALFLRWMPGFLVKWISMRHFASEGINAV